MTKDENRNKGKKTNETQINREDNQSILSSNN